jgi:hypothetical protein
MQVFAVSRLHSYRKKLARAISAGLKCENTKWLVYNEPQTGSCDAACVCDLIELTEDIEHKGTFTTRGYGVNRMSEYTGLLDR